MRRRCWRARRGVLLAAVLVCLAVASAVLLAVLKATVTASRQVQTQAWQAQAGWLAESGLDRAAARLATDANYVGETWRVPLAAFGGVDAGSNATSDATASDVEASDAAADAVAAVVKIEVETVADQPRQRRVRVQADYPDHPEQRARQSRQAVVQLPPAESVPAKEEPIEKSPAESVPVVAPASDSPTNTTEEKP